MASSLTAALTHANENIYDKMAHMIVEIMARRIPSFAYNPDIQRLVSVRETIQTRFPIIKSDEATARYADLLPKVTEAAIQKLRSDLALILRDVIDDEGNSLSGDEYVFSIHDESEKDTNISQAEVCARRALTNFFTAVGEDGQSGLKDLFMMNFDFYECARLSVNSYVDHPNGDQDSDLREAVGCMYESFSYVGCAGNRDECYPPHFFRGFMRGITSRAAIEEYCSRNFRDVQGGFVFCKP